MQIAELNTELAESCVQAFYGASGIGCELCTGSGSVVASAGFSCSVCDICSETGISREDCKRLNAFTAKASEKEDGKYMYECPLGLSCVTSAVLTGQERGARLTIGPFLLEDKEDFIEYDLKTVRRMDPETVSGIEKRLAPVPCLEPQTVNAFSQLLVYSAAFLSASSQSGEDYLERLDQGTVSAWEKANRIDPSQTVENVRAYIEQNYGNDISLLDIAKDAGMTTSYLCRLFKKEQNTTVNAYLTRVRIEKSKELLKTDAPIADIAQMCGFSDQSYFTKVFRQTEGMTPLKYRKNSQNS